MADTALLVPVPEAAPLVDRYRVPLTRAGADGLPPHVTVLYPFTHTGGLTAERLEHVGRIVASQEPFELVLATTGRFELDPPLLYLAPEPAAPFAALTAGLAAAFPEHPPYDGLHDALVPHLTVAGGDAAALDAIEAELLPSLPVRARVTEAWLMARGSDGRWNRRQAFPLGG